MPLFAKRKIEVYLPDLLNPAYQNFAANLKLFEPIIIMNTEIKIYVPVEIASNLAVDENDLSRKTLEALAIEGYRNGRLSIGQVAELLELTVLQTEDFLFDKNVPLNYSAADFEEDLMTINNLNRQ